MMGLILKDRIMTVSFEKDLSDGVFYIDGCNYNVSECSDSCVVYRKFRLKRICDREVFFSEKVFIKRLANGKIDRDKFKYRVVKGRDFSFWLDKFNKVKQEGKL